MNRFFKGLCICIVVVAGLFITACDGMMGPTDKVGQFEQQDIIIKAPAAVLLSEIDSLVPGVRINTITEFGGYQYLSYRTDGTKPVEKILSYLNNDPRIATAENENIYTHFLTPNDTAFADYQYAPKISNCEAAWDNYTGDSSVVVAVIDTGVNGAHQDFGAGKVIAGYNFVSGAAISAGVDSDDNGHGTHCAGIIGAVGNNNLGMAGVAWQTTILPVKVLDSSGSGYTSDITAGIVWAVDNGADVISMSLGGAGYSQIMADAVDYALTNGIIVIVAMGNDGITIKNYPAGYPGVIAVGATNGRDEITSYSTRGSHISVSAPGDNIYSLSGSSNTGYVYMSGTSMATPFISGAAALLLDKNGALTPAEIRSILEDSAVDLGDAGCDEIYGYGRVDVGAAINLSTRNNYGRIRVQVNNNLAPASGVDVLLMNAAGTATVATTRTSTGTTTGGTAGEADFSIVPAGDYLVSVRMWNTIQSQAITLTGADDSLLTFAFTVTIPTSFVIETFPNGGSNLADTVLYVFGSDFSPISSNDDISYPANLYSRVTTSLASGQTYYILIFDQWDDSGYYSLLVNTTGGGSSGVTPLTTAGEPDDTAATSYPIILNTVYDRYLSIGEYDYFAITIP